MTTPDVAVLDLDGTLVDSVYVHAIAWREAFCQVGLDVPTYRLHRAIGMGGDHLVSAVAGDAAEHAVGDVVRDLHDRLFDERIALGASARGGRRTARGLPPRQPRAWSSPASARADTHRQGAHDGGQRTTHRGRRGGIGGAEQACPRPDREEPWTGPGPTTPSWSATPCGTWSPPSAREMSFVGLLTGGYSEAELREAGAVAVFETPRVLAGQLADVLGLIGRADR